MRFSTPTSTSEPVWICLLILVAGCAIEPDEALVDVGQGPFLDLGPGITPPAFDFPELADPNETETDEFQPIVLQGAAPNPIDSQTRLSFAVPRGGARVILSIYGINGRRVKLLVDEVLEDGEYSAFWYGRDDRDRLVPAGVYIVNLRRGAEVKNCKVLLVR